MPGIKPECRSRHLTARCIRMAAVPLAHKRVFPGEGIMIEITFACGNDPAQVQHLSPHGSGDDTGR
jgi:hypothetical protein